MSKKFEKYKGMRLFKPNQHIELERINNAYLNASRLFGFSQYKTPILDSAEVYENKTSEEIMDKQTYSFSDRGDRNVVLRPEITPGVAIMIKEMQESRELLIPAKVFSIGSVFRYENPQKGRTREHIQLNADIFGSSESWAEMEIIELVFKVIEELKLNKKDFVVRINDRKFMQDVLIQLGIDKDDLLPIFRLLDKRNKISLKELRNELKKLTDISIEKIDSMLSIEPESIKKLRLLTTLEDITIEYDPTIVRGFDYYTGIVFEFYAKDKKILERSIAGGGRYDNLIESYGGSKLPVVGVGIGDVSLQYCINAFEKDKKKYAQIPFVLTVTNKDYINKGYKTAHEISTTIQISFIGYTLEKKLTDIYKKYEKGLHKAVISFDGKRYNVRNLETRKDIEVVKISDVKKILKDI